MANRYLLENRGLEILWAPNGWQGINLAKQHQPEAIILDVEMPEIDGYEVCRRLKSDPQTAHIPVILHTSREYAGDLLFGLEMGAIDFIPKDSFSGTVLIATLQELGILDRGEI